MVQTGDELVITGDHGDDQLEVEQGQVAMRVSCKGQERTFFGVERMSIDLREGNDRAEIRVLPYIERVQVRGGNGDDQMIIAILRDAEPHGIPETPLVEMQMLGERGNDRLGAFVTAGAFPRLRLDGAQGDDVLVVSHGAVSEALREQFREAAARIVDSQGPLDPPDLADPHDPHGKFEMRGGGGDDRLNFNSGVDNPEIRPQRTPLELVMDGGAGRNESHAAIERVSVEAALHLSQLGGPDTTNTLVLRGVALHHQSAFEQEGMSNSLLFLDTLVVFGVAPLAVQQSAAITNRIDGGLVVSGGSATIVQAGSGAVRNVITGYLDVDDEGSIAAEQTSGNGGSNEIAGTFSAATSQLHLEQHGGDRSANRIDGMILAEGSAAVLILQSAAAAAHNAFHGEIDVDDEEAIAAVDQLIGAGGDNDFVICLSALRGLVHLSQHGGEGSRNSSSIDGELAAEGGRAQFEQVGGDGSTNGIIVIGSFQGDVQFAQSGGDRSLNYTYLGGTIDTADVTQTGGSGSALDLEFAWWILPGGEVTLVQDGSAGTEHMSLTCVSSVNGSLNFLQLGSELTDRVRDDFQFFGTGSVTGRIDLRGGDDYLQASLRKLGEFQVMQVLVDMGAGYDLANVVGMEVQNAEEMWPYVPIGGGD